jgi:hypothetical protein
LFEEEAPVLAHDLFHDDIHDSINEEVTCCRQASNLDSKQHAGIFQIVLKEQWDGLLDSDKAWWHKITIEMNKQEGGVKSPDQVYKCTAILIIECVAKTCIETRSISHILQAFPSDDWVKPSPSWRGCLSFVLRISEC